MSTKNKMISNKVDFTVWDKNATSNFAQAAGNDIYKDFSYLAHLKNKKEITLFVTKRIKPIYEQDNYLVYYRIVGSNANDFRPITTGDKLSTNTFLRKYENQHEKNQLLIKNQIKMSEKKPTPAQLAARKKFAEMAKNGTLVKKRKAAAPKSTVSKAKSFANSALKNAYNDKPKAIKDLQNSLEKYSNSPNYKTSELIKKRIADLKGAIKILKSPTLAKPQTKGLVTLCSKSVGTTGRRKKDGTLKKGYIVTKGGKVVLKKKVEKKQIKKRIAIL
jgi:hypothetical protein